MESPREVLGARICVLLYSDETVICANSAGFKALGQWMAWLADSNPDESYHLHLLWHLESEASRFDGVRPKNVWFLRETPESRPAEEEPPEGMEVVPFDVTFQVVRETDLDELALGQDNGLIPPKYRKAGPSYVIANDV